MNIAPHRELVEAGLSGIIEYSLLARVAQAASKTPPEMLDDFACYVAQTYAAGEMSFEDADAIMNSAYGVAVSNKFWAEHDRTIPKAMFEVYEAFDAGEYYHRGDGKDVDPELKYTQSRIKQFLAKRRRAQ